VNGYGTIDGTYTIGAITTVGPVKTAPATGTGTFIITDGLGDTLTATVDWIQILTIGNNLGSLNTDLVANLTMVSLVNPGTDPELAFLFSLGHASVGLSWLNNIGDLDALVLAGTDTGHPVLNTNYSGSIIPLPPSALLLGSGLLGLVGLHFRRRKS
jgi:hypothetical protein